MTEAPQDEALVHEGPDPRDWPEAAPKMWGTVLNVEFLNRIIAALDGRVPAGAEQAHGEARSFLNEAREGQRAELAGMILHAYRVSVPEDGADQATEAVGGFHGDGDGPGDRDHV